jgi:hypothetical protein
MIRRAGRQFYDRLHVMRGRPQSTHDAEVAAFVGEKAHSPLRLDKHRFLMRNCIGRIGDGRLDILQQIRGRRPRPAFAG